MLQFKTRLKWRIWGFYIIFQLIEYAQDNSIDDDQYDR